MPRNTVAKINLEALRHNYRLACERAGGAQAMAVVKADGYGHGIAAVTQALATEAGCFAVACLEEALAIRAQGLTHPVVLLQGVHARKDLAVCLQEGFEPVLHSQSQIDWLMADAVRPMIWLKVNTGMNRLGFSPGEFAAVMASLRPMQGIVKGLMTHFACADDTASDATQLQTNVFRDIAGAYPDCVRSVGNSAAHFRDNQALFEWSRPGIMLYGASPMLGASGSELGLRPVMKLESELIAVRTLAAGESVGYGESWTADKPTPMGIVAIGYGDGYPRHAGTGTPAWVGGRRIRLIGRVSMDMLAVDLSDVPTAQVGDRVELWGDHVGVDEVAACAGTIGYELLTGVTARVPRLYSE
ncbi:alanine racemase [Marinobacter caseinilyticus]|uniref:alanine racemase n=1 Tax=Marinobacter caseinilyticus TaxID=2692195 RepID=UPI00140B2A1C|nr:alanine racemase [Marinobacter caseinilyticus]